MLSVIIPNRNSPFLTKTIQDLLNNSVEDIEVLVNVDENKPNEILEDKRVTYLFPEKPVGMRAGINACLSIAKGEYIMKTDDHCLFAQGFDRILKENTQRDWLVIPRRYSLDAENWSVENNPKGPRDYHYLCCPYPDKDHDGGMHGVEWPQRTRERMGKPEFDIDDTPSFQGSCWFANKDYFMEKVGYMDDRVETYSTFAQEPQEIGMKYWLKGGAVKVNKKTYYAHLHKGKRYGRMYKQDVNTVSSHNWSAKHWMSDEEPGIIHGIQWFVEDKFPGMPTWTPDWKEKLVSMGVIHG
jgi:glycosyltransferase involved in cell wall biosynthesis